MWLTLFLFRKGLAMSILYLVLSLIFIISGLQFLRGKWIKLIIIGNASDTDQRKRLAAVLAPGVIVLGIGLFCMGFFTNKLWINAGNILFLLAVVYLVLVVLIRFIRK
jgi:multisubunit Na+/H+ antiporter MnhB subunit